MSSDLAICCKGHGISTLVEVHKKLENFTGSQYKEIMGVIMGLSYHQTLNNAQIKAYFVKL